jgi:CheY-like chemotaxis protein
MAKSLLVVEDDVLMAQLLEQLGRDIGYHVTTVIESAQIMAAYDACQPDIIILDIVMPEMDGFEVLHFLQERECTAQIIVLSGANIFYRVMASKLGHALSLNIVANLAKPFQTEDLRTLLISADDVITSRSRAANS